MGAPFRWALRDGTGRLRLGWRLLLFAVLAASFTLTLGTLLPATVPGAGAALLVGSLVAGWAVLAMEGRPLGVLGFPVNRRSLPASLLGLALGTLVAACALTGISLGGGVSWALGDGSPSGWLRTGGSAMALYLLPAAGEEAFFRGYPLWATAASLGRLPALLATSAVFGAMHLGNPSVGWIGATNVAAMGLFLGALLLRTGSLWWATGAHLGWNFTLGFTADLPVSGLDLVDAPGVVATTSGPDWLSGGAFGPEGSLVTTVVALAAAVWVWWTPRLEAWSVARGPGGSSVEGA